MSYYFSDIKRGKNWRLARVNGTGAFLHALYMIVKSEVSHIELMKKLKGS